MLAVIGNSVEVLTTHDSGGVVNNRRVVLFLNELLSVNSRLLVVLILDSWLLVDVLFLVWLVDRHVIRVRVRVLETRIHCMVVILDRPNIMLIVEVVIELGTRNVLDLCIGFLMLLLFRVAIMSPIRVEFLSLVN